MADKPANPTPGDRYTDVAGNVREYQANGSWKLVDKAATPVAAAPAPAESVDRGERIRASPSTPKFARMFMGSGEATDAGKAADALEKPKIQSKGTSGISETQTKSISQILAEREAAKNKSKPSPKP